MKKINLPSGNYLFVEVANDAYDFHFKCFDGQRNYRLVYFINNKPRIYSKPADYKFNSNVAFINEKDLPKIISTTNDITEEQASLIAEKGIKQIKAKPNWDKDWEIPSYQKLFMGYAIDNNEKVTKLPVHQIAKESLQSLMQANNLNIENNYLILLKTK